MLHPVQYVVRFSVIASRNIHRAALTHSPLGARRWPDDIQWESRLAHDGEKSARFEIR
jgi:hypothetical protein